MYFEPAYSLASKTNTRAHESSTAAAAVRRAPPGQTAKRGWNSHVQRELPGMFESSNLSRDDLSREIGRSGYSGSGRRLARRPRGCSATATASPPASAPRAFIHICIIVCVYYNAHI